MGYHTIDEIVEMVKQGKSIVFENNEFIDIMGIMSNGEVVKLRKFKDEGHAPAAYMDFFDMTNDDIGWEGFSEALKLEFHRGLKVTKVSDDKNLYNVLLGVIDSGQENLGN
jgi:hypothetical protein